MDQVRIRLDLALHLDLHLYSKLDKFTKGLVEVPTVISYKTRKNSPFSILFSKLICLRDHVVVDLAKI